MSERIHEATPASRWLRGVAAAASAVGVLAITACTAPGGPGTATPSVQPHSVENLSDSAGRGTLKVDGCTLLGPGNVFTQPIDAMQAESSARIDWAAAKLAQNRRSLNAGASNALDGVVVYGFPLNSVTGSTFIFNHIGELSASGAWRSEVEVLFPTGEVHWEGETVSGWGDRHLLVLDTTSCRLQEHITFAKDQGGATPGYHTSGAAVEWPSQSTGQPTFLGPENYYAEAAHIPITPLTYRYDEVYSPTAGDIHHTLRMTLPTDLISESSTRWPATGTDGDGTDPLAIPMGSRLRLKTDVLQSLENNGAEAGALKVLRALNRYGAVVADSTAATYEENPGFVALSGEFNPGWPMAFFDTIGSVSLSDFEIVDVSCWNDGGSGFTVNSTAPTAC